ncbi:MAG: methyltransferase [Desulfobulbus propionicus]|nr:MAG: methyltransferase [Desulfobulbus propionicus]
MDPQTLPAEELALYTSLKQRYKIAFEPLKVGTTRLDLLRITDLERLLDGKDPLKDVSAFPFWTKLWEASIVLANLLVSRPVQEKKTLLELGAGLGVPGLAAARAGFQVTLTDYDQLILDFARVSGAASGVENVEYRMLDWLDPPDLPRYDVVVGAEVLFREEFFAPLLGVLRKTLKPEGVVYFAHDSTRQSLRPFLEMAEAEYVIAASTRKLKNLDQEKQIVLTRLTPRN